MSALVWSLPGVPLTAGAALAAAGRHANPVAPGVGVGIAVATLGLGIAAAVLRPAASAPLFAGIEAEVRVDGLSAVLVVAVAAVTAAVLAAASGDRELRPDRARFVGLILLFSGAMMITVTAATLPLLLMGWEAMGAASWALIGFWWRQPGRVRAAHTAFLTTRAADLGLYLAAGAALAGGVGSLRLDALPHTATPWLSVLTAGVVVAALGKSAQLPFSFWLSHAMQGPSPVSALLHSATMVAAGAYLLIRLHPLLAATGWAGPAVAWVGAGTALLLGLVAVAQTDLKQLLAASTSAQVGFMVMAAGSGGIAAGTAQWLAHAATKSLLFLAAGAWLTAFGTGRLEELRGAAKRQPLVGVPFCVGALSLAGLPPASLWAAKDEVLAVTLARQPALYAVGFTAAVIATVYTVKMAWYVLRPAPAAGPQPQQDGTGQVPRSVGLPMVLLAVAAAALGALTLPGPWHALRQAVGDLGAPYPAGWQLAASAGVALVTAALAWRRGPVPVRLPAALTGWLARWLDLDTLARLVVVRPTLTLARALATMDDRVVDGLVWWVARAGMRVARAARRFDDARLDGLVASVAAGARSLGTLARRPQTGLLHQYYAQVAVALGALALFLLIVR